LRGEQAAPAVAVDGKLPLTSESGQNHRAKACISTGNAPPGREMALSPVKAMLPLGDITRCKTSASRACLWSFASSVAT